MPTPTGAAPTHAKRAADWRKYLAKKAGSSTPLKSQFVDQAVLTQAAIDMTAPIMCSQRELHWVLGVAPGTGPSTSSSGPNLGKARIDKGDPIAEVVASLAQNGIAQAFLPTTLRVMHVGRLYLAPTTATGASSVFKVNRSYQSGMGRIVTYIVFRHI
jgi:hypothetical protein